MESVSLNHEMPELPNYLLLCMEVVVGVVRVGPFRKVVVTNSSESGVEVGVRVGFGVAEKASRLRSPVT